MKTGQLSKYFHRSEFACRCGCGYDTVDAELILVLDDIRFVFGNPVFINSGSRCFDHNEAVQKEYNVDYKPGASKSMHMHGKAADIKVVGAYPSFVAEYLERSYPDCYGIGRYHNRTHIDVRQSRARWKVAGVDGGGR